MYMQSTNRFLTVVFQDLSPDEVEQLTYHPKCRAASWSHALNDRDLFKFRINKLLNENSNLDD